MSNLEIFDENFESSYSNRNKVPSEHQANDKEYVLSQVRRNGHTLRVASSKLRDDP